MTKFRSNFLWYTYPSEADNKENDTDSSSTMSSSTTTIGKEKLFSGEECAFLHELCKELISKPPISIERFKRALKESKEQSCDVG